MPEGDTTTITVPRWAKALGIYAIGLVPVIAAWWLQFNFMIRDIDQLKAKDVKVEARVVELESADRQRELAQTEMSSDLKYIRETMDRVENTMERLATQ